jgi:GTP-binding protein EngB required for normal cell division
MSDPTLQLNDFHRNALNAGFQYMDRLLSDALAGLVPAENGALFATLRPDATAVQRKVIADHATRLRREMRKALDACGLTVRPPEVGALWSLRSALIAMDITLEELGPDYLRGYGEMDGATAAGVSALQAQMRTCLNELRSYLDAGLGGDLTARLARLDQTRDEVRLLRELDRIITAHGLVEFRQMLAYLLERLEKNLWVVAFVGRVSCGKSSLLNYLLATDVLPSGVTPITAVPIRIVPGAQPAATVFFATQKPERIAAARLADFASEERNPGNARHVTDILLELPAPRLAGEICFVDTPGLGSLATAGAAQTLAFLPRCDLGVLLLDAGATLAEEDLAVMRALLEGGADVLAVLSKADLLGPADRTKVLAYTARHLADSFGRDLPVAPVSIISGHAALTEEWFTAMMAPRLARHRDLAAVTLRRKTGALRDAVAAALATRSGLDSDSAARTDRSPVRDAARAPLLGAARAALDTNRRQLHELAFRETPSADELLAILAQTLAAQPASPRNGDDFAAAVAVALNREVARLGGRFEELLRETRNTVTRALVAGEESPDSVALPHPYTRPLFDPAPILAAGQLSSGWRRWPGEAVRRAALRHHLRAQLSSVLDDALRVHAQALVGWGQRYLDQLAAHFNAQAGFLEARAGATPAPGGSDPGALRRDLDLLRHWNIATPAA